MFNVADMGCEEQQRKNQRFVRSLFESLLFICHGLSTYSFIRYHSLCLASLSERVGMASKKEKKSSSPLEGMKGVKVALQATPATTITIPATTTVSPSPSSESKEAKHCDRCESCGQVKRDTNEEIEDDQVYHQPTPHHHPPTNQPTNHHPPPTLIFLSISSLLWYDR
jgi:hypothetical protein